MWWWPRPYRTTVVIIRCWYVGNIIGQRKIGLLSSGSFNRGVLYNDCENLSNSLIEYFEEMLNGSHWGFFITLKILFDCLLFIHQIKRDNFRFFIEINSNFLNHFLFLCTSFIYMIFFLLNSDHVCWKDFFILSFLL